MKFFSTALAALAVGSAVAAPVNDVRSIPAVSVPCPCDDKPGATLPSISLPVPCTTLSTTGVIQATALPAVYHPGKHDTGHIGNDKVVIVIHTVVETVNTVEVKVKAHLNLIAHIIAASDVDAQALLKVILDLKADLKVLQDCVPTLHGLIFEVEGLVAADLQVVLDLVLGVEALLAEVEACLKGLVVLKAEILAVIGVELQACLGLIVAIADPIVEFALGIVADLHVDAVLFGLIGQITDCTGRITTTCGGIKSLLGPVLNLLHL